MKRKSLLIICSSILFLMLSCKNQTSHNNNENAEHDSVFIDTSSEENQESNVQKSKKLYDELFSLIDSNDCGDLSDSEFKPQADLIKYKIDSLQLLLNSTEKQIVKSYGNLLLNNLIQKKAKRDN